MTVFSSLHIPQENENYLIIENVPKLITNVNRATFPIKLCLQSDHQCRTHNFQIQTLFVHKFTAGHHTFLVSVEEKRNYDVCSCPKDNLHDKK